MPSKTPKNNSSDLKKSKDIAKSIADAKRYKGSHGEDKKVKR